MISIPRGISPATMRAEWNKDHRTVFYIESGAYGKMAKGKIRIIAWGRLSIFCSIITYGGPSMEILIRKSDIVVGGHLGDPLEQFRCRLFLYERVKQWNNAQIPKNRVLYSRRPKKGGLQDD